MVDSWRVTDLAEVRAFTSAPLPGLDGMHVGRYRRCAPAGAYIFETEYPEFDVDYRVVGNGEGLAKAHLAQGVLTLGTIARFYQSDTHTVVLLEGMCYFCGGIARSTDPLIRIRMRVDYEEAAALRVHTVEAAMPSEHEADLRIHLPVVRVRLNTEFEE